MRDNQRTGAEEGTSSTLGPMVNGDQVGPHNEELEDIINQHLPIGSIDKVNLQKKPIDIGQRPCSRKRRAMAQMTKDKDRGHVVGKEIQAGVTIGKYNGVDRTTEQKKRLIYMNEKKRTDATNDNIRLRIIMSWPKRWEYVGSYDNTTWAEVVVIREEINESWKEVEGEDQ
ncbi:hypothetical protein PPACK8108_LOCUS3843 [Phakopsora pachyrhizi]|uniref:Uncharacterized protein n=1 Tax=Phakopsora pachyrhizi TaxID=170000 RepID=A0AAV0AKT8_PHAPC|nr:hypothetical protein PPACK8108_LOCUS3843 [Phakopsora pachyrhizi]